MAHALVRPGPRLTPEAIRELGPTWDGAGAYWTQRLRRGPPCDEVQPWPVGLIRLAPEYLIAYIASEAVAEWRPQVEEVLSGYEMACWGYCQHVHTYLPTDELIKAGGYEVDIAPLCTNFWPQRIATGTNLLVKNGALETAATLGADTRIKEPGPPRRLHRLALPGMPPNQKWRPLRGQL